MEGGFACGVMILSVFMSDGRGPAGAEDLVRTGRAEIPRDPLPVFCRPCGTFYRPRPFPTDESVGYCLSPWRAAENGLARWSGCSPGGAKELGWARCHQISHHPVAPFCRPCGTCHRPRPFPTDKSVGYCLSPWV